MRIHGVLLAALFMSNAAMPAPVAAEDALPTHVENPFCSASIASVVPWSATSDAPSATASTARYRLRLAADKPVEMSASVVLMSDSTVYRVSVPATAITRNDDVIRSRPFFVSLPQAAALRYAYVDGVAQNGNTASCATIPDAVVSVEKAKADTYDSDAEIVTLIAAVDGPTPTLTCDSVYRPAQARGVFHGARYVRTLQTVSTQVSIWIDSNGQLAGYAIGKSSGNEAVDREAILAARATTYDPARFYCVNVPGEYTFRYTNRGQYTQ